MGNKPDKWAMPAALRPWIADNVARLFHRAPSRNADRDAMSDVDVLPSLLRESLEELLEAAK